MIREGHVVLFAFPQTTSQAGKLRPALVLRQLPGHHDDWLLCMISAQLHQTTQGFDDVVAATDVDFAASGLKRTSVIRITRLAVVERSRLIGCVGELGQERLQRIRGRLAKWLAGR